MRNTNNRLARSIARTALVLTSAAAVAFSLTACGGTGTDSSGGKTVTVYSADGLGDWYKPLFAKFKDQTGIAVNYVEAGSGEVVSRVEKEQSNPQADIVVTLPPFIQKADKSGLLQASGVDFSSVAATDKAADGNWVTLAGNYLCWIANPSVNVSTAKVTWDDLLKPDYKGKLQYSTPGQAGDGTAVLVLLQQLYGKQGALDYLGKLQANNVGPSASTGKLQPKVDKGELLVANGDVQMNLASVKDGSKFSVFFPAGNDGKQSTVALPYAMGLAKGAPHSDAAKKLMDFMLSADAQKTLPDAFAVPARQELADAPATGNGPSPAQVIKNVTVVHPDWNKVVDDLDADVAAYSKATGS